MNGRRRRYPCPALAGERRTWLGGREERRGAIRGVALDVFEPEPLPLNSEWRTTKWGVDGRAQVLLTPHMGYVEEDTLVSWYKQQVENILRWQKGEPLATIFKDSGY